RGPREKPQARSGWLGHSPKFRGNASERRCKPFTVRAVLVSASIVLASCTSGTAEPSKGSYTIQFPSTAAAVATDYVQILVFDVAGPENRATICEDLVTARLTDPSALKPSVNPPAPAANICEMRLGRKPVTVPYGEHALLAIAQRQVGQDLRDFMIGC